VVDNLMPELSGLDLIRELSASTTAGEMPQVVMMTAHATVESALESYVGHHGSDHSTGCQTACFFQVIRKNP